MYSAVSGAVDPAIPIRCIILMQNTQSPCRSPVGLLFIEAPPVHIFLEPVNSAADISDHSENSIDPRKADTRY